MAPGEVRSTRQPNAQAQPNVNQQDSTTINDGSGDGKRKKTRNKFLKKYLKKSNVKPRIVIEEGMMTPVGEWSQPLTDVNIICRQYAPLNCRDWINLDNDQKEVLFHDRIKKLSVQNSANRQHQEVNHCAGSVSFARFQHKKCDLETRQPLGQIELYHQTHFSDKRGRWVAPIAAEKTL